MIFQKGLDYKDIILVHGQCSVQSRSDCDPSVVLGDKLFQIPLTPANMKSVLNKRVCKIFDDNKCLYVFPRNDGIKEIKKFVKEANKENWYSISISVGVTPGYLTLLKEIKDEGLRLDYCTIDIAHGYTDRIIPIVRYVKKNLPNTYLIAGNGGTAEYIRFLENFGVDCAKIHQGVSKACRTRQYTGFSTSTVTSLLECVDAAKHVKIMADGGVTVGEDGEVWIGDIAKAIALGADFVMSSAVFAGCDDTSSLGKHYYGNASIPGKNGDRKHVEGAAAKIKPLFMSVADRIKMVKESLQSSISYSGGNKLQDLRNARIMQIGGN